MQRYLAMLLLFSACGPIKLPGDTGSPDEGSSGDGGSSASTSGDASTSGGSIGSAGSSGMDPTVAPTSGDPGSTSGPDGTSTMTEPPTTDASATEDPPGETTGEPLPALTQVFPLHMEQGPHSGLEGIALWQSGMPDGCEDPPPASCTELPQLGEPLLLVDGLVQDADAVQLSSRVAVLFPFAHPACEMGCGKISFTVQLGEDGVGGDGLGGLPVDLPCSTQASDVWIGIDFNVVTLKDQYTAKLALTDRCGATTEAQELVFTPK